MGLCFLHMDGRANPVSKESGGFLYGSALLTNLSHFFLFGPMLLRKVEVMIYMSYAPLTGALYLGFLHAQD
jgi:hypothetical protein